jgi:hypothetical protein
MTLHKAGGFAACLLATTMVVGIVLNFTVLAIPTTANEVEHTALLVDRAALLVPFILALYVGFGIGTIVLSQALGQRLKLESPSLAQVGSLFGASWGTLLIGSGLVYKAGLEAVVALLPHAPIEAAQLMRMTTLVHEGLGCACEVPGGLWLLLSGLAWNHSLPRPWRCLSVLTGVAGLLTLVPPLYAYAVGVFAFGCTIWMAWTGWILLRTRNSP